MRSIKSECLDRMIFFGEDALQRAVHEYLAHYHAERNHQGLGNAIIAPLPRFTKAVGRMLTSVLRRTSQRDTRVAESRDQRVCWRLGRRFVFGPYGLGTNSFGTPRTASAPCP